MSLFQSLGAHAGVGVAKWGLCQQPAVTGTEKMQLTLIR